MEGVESDHLGEMKGMETIDQVIKTKTDLHALHLSKVTGSSNVLHFSNVA
jgi:hypothetical protein